MQKKNILLLLAVVILLILLAIIVVTRPQAPATPTNYNTNTNNTAPTNINNSNQNTNTNAPKEMSIVSFDVKDGMFVATTKNTAHTEIWATPTGTDATPVLLGIPSLDTKTETAGSTQETWTMKIPTEQMTYTEIIIKAFSDSTATARVTSRPLPYSGATEIFNVLWGSGDEKGQ